MKKTVSVILCVLVCVGLLAACGSRQPEGSGNQSTMTYREQLVGTWNQISEDGSPSLPDMGIPSAYIFNIDGTGLDTFWDMTFKYTADGEILHISYDDSLGEDWDYQYVIEGDVITMTRVDDDAVTMWYQKEKPEEETETTESQTVEG